MAAAAVLVVAVTLPARTYAAGDDALARTGIRTSGQVLAAGWSYAGRGGRPVSRVAYTYATRPYETVVTSPPPGTLPAGTRMSLVVDPEDPTHVRAEGVAGTTAPLEWWTTLGSLGALGLLGLGVVRVVRRYRWRRELQRRPWVRAAVDVAAAGRAQAVRITTSQVEAVASAPRGVRLPGRSTGGVLPGPGRRVLVQAGDGPLVQVRLPQAVAVGRRLLRALDADPQD